MYSKLKDQERQGQLIKERIEERKRRSKQETSLTHSPTGQREQIFVINVNESVNTLNTVD